MFEVTICSYEDIKASGFCLTKQFTVFEGCPPEFKGGRNLMICEVFAQGNRCALVKKHFHYAASSECAACSNTWRTCCKVTPGNQATKS